MGPANGGRAGDCEVFGEVVRAAEVVVGGALLGGGLLGGRLLGATGLCCEPARLACDVAAWAERLVNSVRMSSFCCVSDSLRSLRNCALCERETNILNVRRSSGWFARRATASINRVQPELQVRLTQLIDLFARQQSIQLRGI